MATETKYCDHCGAKMVEYRHNLNKGLVAALVKLSQYGSAHIVDDLQLTTNQICNFAKLKYWGLAQHASPPDGPSKSGYWKITPLGVQFVNRTAKVHKAVWTYRDRVERFDGDLVWVSDILPGYEQRPDYVKNSVPHGEVDERQTSLF